MWSYDQSLIALVFISEKLSWTRFYRDLIRKITFLERRSRFKFNNLGLALGMALKLYGSVAKRLKLKLRKFLGPILTFVEVTGDQLVGDPFCPPILNGVKLKKI